MGFNWRFMLAVAIIAGYFIMPLDLIPDALPVVGWIDDIVVAALSYIFLIRR